MGASRGRTAVKRGLVPTGGSLDSRVGCSRLCTPIQKPVLRLFAAKKLLLDWWNRSIAVSAWRSSLAFWRRSAGRSRVWFQIPDAGFGYRFAGKRENRLGWVLELVRFWVPEQWWARLLVVASGRRRRGIFLLDICRCCRRPRKLGFERGYLEEFNSMGIYLRGDFWGIWGKSLLFITFSHFLSLTKMRSSW